MSDKDTQSVSGYVAGLYDRHPVAAPLLSGVAGYKLLADPRTVSQLTGTEHLFHSTPVENVPGILREGLKVDRSFDPGSPSAHEGFFRLAKGHVFAGRTMGPIRQQSAIHSGGTFVDHVKSLLLPDRSRRVLKIRVPYDELEGLGLKVDPAWGSAKRAIEGMSNPVRRLAYYMDNRLYSPRHTYAFTRDVGPQYVVGGSGFRHGLRSELRRMLSYARKHPGRFARGARNAGVGAVLLALVGRHLYRLAQARKEGS